MLPPPLRLAQGAAYTLGMCQLAMARKALGADDELVRDMTKEWAEGMARQMEIEVLTSGVDAVDWSKPYVLMANHQSYLDVLALYRALPRCFGIVAKKSLFRVPFFGSVMRALGCVEVDRGRRAQAAKAMSEAGERMRATGTTIAVFPEGTRGDGRALGALKKGPFHLAQLAGVGIVPVGIVGTAALMPRSNTSIRPGTVEVNVGNPIPAIPSGDRVGRQRAMDEVRERLLGLARLSAG